MEDNSQRREEVRTPSNWWYISKFCCCSVETGVQIISCWDCINFLVVSVFMVFCLMMKGGAGYYLGPSIKYLIIVTVIFYLIAYIPASMTIFLRWDKKAVAHYIAPRIVSVVLGGIWDIIVLIATSVFMEYKAGYVVLFVLMYVLIYVGVQSYMICCLKSYIVQPDLSKFDRVGPAPNQQVIIMQQGPPPGVYAQPPPVYMVQGAPPQPYGVPVGQPVPQYSYPPPHNYPPPPKQLH